MNYTLLIFAIITLISIVCNMVYTLRLIRLSDIIKRTLYEWTMKEVDNYFRFLISGAIALVGRLAIIMEIFNQ